MCRLHIFMLPNWAILEGFLAILDHKIYLLELWIGHRPYRLSRRGGSLSRVVVKSFWMVGIQGYVLRWNELPWSLCNLDGDFSEIPESRAGSISFLASLFSEMAFKSLPLGYYRSIHILSISSTSMRERVEVCRSRSSNRTSGSSKALYNSSSRLK